MGRFVKDATRPLLLEDDDSSTGLGISSKSTPLYEESAMMEMKSSICEGYITLLNGTCEQPKPTGLHAHCSRKDIEEKALTLAFAALTTGNVIDACFGVRIASKPSNQILGMIKEAKNAIDEAVLENESIAQVAVNAYKAGFQSIIDMNMKLDKLNIFTACFCEKKIRDSAKLKLQQSFSKLDQAINSNYY